MPRLVIEEIDAPENGDTRRRYYAISEFGREVLEAEAERLDRVVELARAARRA